MPSSANPLVVRVRNRSGHERMDPKRAHALSLECGYPNPTAENEYGRMVSILVDSMDEMPHALRALADLWNQAMTRKSIETPGQPEPVYFQVGLQNHVIHMDARDLPQRLERTADMLRGRMH